VRETLQALRTVIPLEVHEVPTGTRAYDWFVDSKKGAPDGGAFLNPYHPAL